MRQNDEHLVETYNEKIDCCKTLQTFILSVHFTMITYL